jgi:hypothetical protein
MAFSYAMLRTLFMIYLGTYILFSILLPSSILFISMSHSHREGSVSQRQGSVYMLQKCQVGLVVTMVKSRSGLSLVYLAGLCAVRFRRRNGRVGIERRGRPFQDRESRRALSLTAPYTRYRGRGMSVAVVPP